MNWYGRTKLLGERAVESFAEGAFPAHCYLKSNLYGRHTAGDREVSKETVINFFINRVAAGEPLIVYEPGIQSRNFILDDVARAYVHSAERLRAQLDDGVRGTERFEIASDEDPSVMAVAELVQSLARETGEDVSLELVENLREETPLDSFVVDTSTTRSVLGWAPEYTVEASVRGLLRDLAQR